MKKIMKINRHQYYFSDDTPDSVFFPLSIFILNTLNSPVPVPDIKS